MNPQDLPGGIASRLTGLVAGILRHALAIGALAALETRQLIRQSVAILLLAVATLLAALIAYVAILAAIVSLLAVKLSWGWPVSLGAAGLLHLAVLGILFSILRGVSAPRAYEATAAELTKDLETLGRLGGDPTPRP